MTVNTVLVNILLGVATAIGTTVVPYLIAMGRKFIKAKLGEEKSKAALTAYNYVSTIAYDVVKAAQETVVKETRAANSDGKITKEEMADIKAKVAAEVKDVASTDAMQAIGKDGSNIDKLISNMIESRLKDIKDETKVIDSQLNGGQNGNTNN